MEIELEPKIVNSLVKSVKNNFNVCEINLKDGNTISLHVEGECCNITSFIFPYGKLEDIVGKRIKSITEDKNIKIKFDESSEYFVDNNFSPSNDCIDDIAIRMEFFDSEDFIFAYRNISNGYYSGHFYIKV